MILVVTQSFLPDVGGTQQYLTGLADAFAARGHAIEVFCRKTSRSAAKAFDATRSYTIHRYGGIRIIRQLRVAATIARRVRQGDVTVIVADSWKSLELLDRSKLKGVRIVCIAHGNEYLTHSAIKAGRLRRSLAKADVVAANSRFTAGLAHAFAGSVPVEVVLPGIMAPGEAREAVAAAPQGERLLCIARLEPRKGIDQIIRALAELQADYPQVVLDIVGKGEDKDRLIALAEQLGVTGRMHFHGYVSDARKAELIRQARVFVLPNRREHGSVEGFGLVFLEAAAYGVPSIAGKDGGVGDAVIDGETGLIVDGEDVATLTAGLRRLLSDEALRQRMGAQAQTRFWSEFVWHAAVTRFETVLNTGPKTGDET
ncbi:GDP-mannose-dependent alpha-(1-6)-phosphatidylinositol monomannoside mannosyltransferase [Asticcacaulis sp. MM231]|uniref:glycosyltransferase family 4 protein n=1 Tax=Asticcacaulis sp. MM231 TaxID=3157666 RepID=UPI0032D5A9A9